MAKKKNSLPPKGTATETSLPNVTLKAEHPSLSGQAIHNGFAEAIGMGNNPFNLPMFGVPGGEQISQSTTLFKNLRWYLVSNFRQLLSQIYVEIGLVQTIVDVPVDDALRGGIEIKSKQLDEEQIEELNISLDRDNDINTAGQAAKWNRLFGGAGIIILTDQDPETELDLDAITTDTPLEFRAVDLWELFWDKQNTEGYDPEQQTEDFETYDYYGEKLHKSRVMRLKGFTAPSFIRPRLRGWGFSVVEVLVRSINQYLKATDLGFEVLDEFKVDVYKIKNLVNTLLSPNGQEKIQKRVALANRQKNYQNAVVMDSEDDWDHKQLSFAGLAEAMAGIRMQVAADMRMPMTKLFGISAAGFNSGEDDIEVYNSMVESQVRNKIKYDLLRICEIKCQKLFGFVPDDISITFKPLRVLSAEQEENVKTQKFARLLQMKQAGELSTLEFREACNKGNLLDISLDTTEDVLNPVDPEVQEIVKEGPNDPNKPPYKDDPGANRETTQKARAVSEYGANPKKNAFEESKHPRAADGKFGEGGGKSSKGKESTEKVFEKDKDEAINKILTMVDDKHYDAFMDKIESLFEKAKTISIGPEEASKIKRSHNFTFESDPDNDEMHKRSKETRGKNLKDPSIVVSFGGELYALDGQHRLNRAIAKKEETNVVVIDLDFAKDYGVDKSLFVGKKTFENQIKPYTRVQRIDRVLANSAEFDRASYEADGGDNWIDSRRSEFFENPGNVDESLWMKAKDASVAAFGKVKWQFVTWWYKKHGGKFT